MTNYGWQLGKPNNEPLTFIVCPLGFVLVTVFVWTVDRFPSNDDPDTALREAARLTDHWAQRGYETNIDCMPFWMSEKLPERLFNAADPRMSQYARWADEALGKASMKLRGDDF